MSGFGARVKSLRKARGLTQGELARAIGIKQPSLSELEQGESKEPSAATLLAVARALQVSAEWLYTGIGNPLGNANLTDDETALLGAFRSLDARGKADLARYSTVLAETHGRVTAPTPRIVKK